ncbi:MAG: response regulator transcription factor [Maribacter sp.]|uniref:response regulator transcription factor n=1 Tax=Maribacter sp. TaxID=1897614 RepID=UPI00329900A5
MITVLIADDHKLFRQGMVAMLGEAKNIKVIGEAADGYETLELLAELEPKVLLLDIEMPIIDGFEVLKRLKKAKLNTKVLVLTMHSSAEFIKNIVKAGAAGYLKKDSDKQLLLNAIQDVHNKGNYYPPDTTYLVLQSLQERNKGELISPREKEVVILISEGMTTKEIAEKLFLSKHTIESHRQNILLKLDLKNSAELVKYAIKRGWV